jgi:5-methylcytosine-specific restriction endonuclease McrA
MPARSRNERGSAEDRRRRRLRTTVEVFDGRWAIVEPGARVTCALRIDPRCPGTVTVETMHIDHIVPAVLGGRLVWGNYQPTCPHCNNRKSDRLL